MAVSRCRADKALEVLLYILSHGCTNIYNVLKVIYFADKEHLKIGACTMYRESYIAMKAGPVPSCAYDIVKNVQRRNPNNPYTEQYAGLMPHEAIGVVDQYHIKALRDYDPEYFSDVDYACLDNAISKYGDMEFNHLRKKSHEGIDYRESDRDGEISFDLLVKAVDTGDGDLKEFLDCVIGVEC